MDTRLINNLKPQLSRPRRGKWMLAAALVCGGIFAAGVFAQSEIPTFRGEVTVVSAPVTVMDKDGRYVAGLEPRDFEVLDNGKLQEFKVDVSFVPISLVVAIQANSSVEVVLPSIKKIGPLLENLVIGEAGEAAILAFDHRLRLMQSFTNDGKLFTKALEKINAGSSTSAMVDSVYEATRMLRNRPKDRRKILLLISETQDRGSEGGLREALLGAQIHNIIIYSININRAVTKLSEKMPPPRPNNFPAGSRPVPGGAPNTPSTIEALTGYRGQTTDFVPVFVEIFKQVKAIFVPNPLEVLTRYTGGREFSFLTQRDMEEVVSRLGEELHSQYLVSYTPSADVKLQGGWHDIKVNVARRDVKVRTRDGYWMATLKE